MQIRNENKDNSVLQNRNELDSTQLTTKLGTYNANSPHVMSNKMTRKNSFSNKPQDSKDSPQKDDFKIQLNPNTFGGQVKMDNLLKINASGSFKN